MRLESIRIYPVKSGGEVALDQSEVDRSGLRHDRRWMIVDPEGRFVTRRTVPALAGLAFRDDGASWRLGFEGSEGCLLPKSPDEGRSMDVEIWGQRVRALEGPREAAEWLSGRLQRDVCLVYVPDTDLRPVDREYGRPGDVVSFADGYPLLLVNEASVRAVSDAVGRTLSERRFRPNLVFSGAGAFEEDGWAAVLIGEVSFDVVKPCARCQVVEQDPDSGKPDGGVLRALGATRRVGRKVLFGENLIPRSGGAVRVGDSLVVLERREEGSVIMDG